MTCTRLRGGFLGTYTACLVNVVQSSSLCIASSHPLQTTVCGEKSAWEAGILIVVPDLGNNLQTMPLLSDLRQVV